MRKLNFIVPTGYFGILLTLALIFGCAGISFESPITQKLTKSPIFNAGYEIAKNISPSITKEIIHHSTVGEENVFVLYPNWKRYLSYRLTNPDHRDLIDAVLKVVDLSLVFKPSEEQEKIIRDLFTELISGLEAGIAASLK